MVGLATDYCVRQTALDALREGFRVTIDRRRHPRDRRARRATPSARSTSCGRGGSRGQVIDRVFDVDVPLVPPRRATPPTARGCSSATACSRRVVPAAPERAVVERGALRERRRPRGGLRRGRRRLCRDRREVDGLGPAGRRRGRARCSRAAGTARRAADGDGPRAERRASARRPTRSQTGPPTATLAEVGPLNDRAYRLRHATRSRARSGRCPTARPTSTSRATRTARRWAAS